MKVKEKLQLAIDATSYGLNLLDDALLSFGTGLDTRISWDTTDANANELLIQLPAGGAVNVPVIIVGQAIESVDPGLYNGVVDPRIALFGVGAVTTAPIIEFRKARGTFTSPTVVTSADDLGTLDFYGAVAAGEYVRAASIRADMTGTIATTRGPGNLSFNVATDAAPSVMTERLLITASGLVTLTPATDVVVADSTGLIIGATAQVSVDGALYEAEILGSAGADSGVLIGRWSADAGGPALTFIKSRHATIGSNTAVNSGDTIGTILFYGADGGDFNSLSGYIRLSVDGTPGAGDMPGRFGFFTSPDGSETPVERLRIASTGLLTISAGSTPASVGTTPGTAHAGSITSTGGLGGNTTIATTGTGGIGAGYSFTGGAGGTADSATTAATGGAGGAWAVTTGAGAAAAVAGVTATGGDGGDITFSGGAGGAVSLAVSGTATGGRGADITITSGIGGAVTATTGTNVGGAGGTLALVGGAGGAASGATDTGGAGAAITITAGAGGAGDTGGVGANITLTAGAAGTGGNVAGGIITFTAGAATGTGTVGYVRTTSRLEYNQGADIASANDLTLGADGNIFEITGTTQINAITTAGWQNGAQIVLLFTSTPTVKYNTAGGAGTAVCLLASATDFVASAGDTLTLVLSEIGGTQAWREIGRAVI